MDLQTLAEGINRGEIAPLPCPSEGDWQHAWQSHHVGAHDPFTTAALGGALSDRLSWVFVSGYQACIRHCFAQLDLGDEWCSFVNTEDRNGELPGVTLDLSDGQARISGWKTWLAASDHVENLLVSVRTDEPWRFVRVRRDAPGVSIETGPMRGFLPELAQGRVQFSNVDVAPDELPGGDEIYPQFGIAEAAYVRVALNAFMLSVASALGGPHHLIGETLAGLFASASLVQLPLQSDAAAAAMLGIDVRTRGIAAEFEQFIAERDPALHERWTQDRRLVEMAAAGIANRAERALGDEA